MKKKDELIPDIQIPVPEVRGIDEYIPSMNSECLDLEKISNELEVKRNNPTSIIKYDEKKESIVNNPFTKQDYAQDFKNIRDILLASNESAKKILKEIPMDGGLLKPAMLMALNSIYKTINDNGRLLVDMYKEIVAMDKRETKKAEEEAKITNNNTFIFTGDTNDLNETLDNLIKKNSMRKTEIIQAEVIDEK